MATTEQTPKSKSTTDLAREYIVFGQVDSPLPEGSYVAAWSEVGRCVGKNADEARDKVIDALPVDEQGGPFVTIAARYWQPETFEIETTTVRKARR
jgi:hypothetical protein